MLIQKKIGNLADFEIGERVIDYLPVEWYECQKRILHKKTLRGKDVILKFLAESHSLVQDDVLYADEAILIVMEVMACEAIVVQPKTLYEMAMACYEIGNKHLPLYYDEGALLIPFDQPTFRLLEASGLEPSFQRRKLMKPLRTSVAAHLHLKDKETLFSRVMKLASAHE